MPLTITVIESVPEKVLIPKRQSTNNAAAMIGLFKKENCCVTCELVSQKPADLIKCKGICQNSFHIECLKLDEEASISTETWKCEECTSGKAIFEKENYDIKHFAGFRVFISSTY